MKDLSKHYGTLTADERLKVAFDAMARGDWQEARTLGETCPKVQYVAQRDMAFTGKFGDLQLIAFIHAVFFWKNQYSVMTAMAAHDMTACTRCCIQLASQVEAFDRFCEHAGYKAETVLLACGLVLDRDTLDNTIKPDETMIESMYQSYLLNWE